MGGAVDGFDGEGEVGDGAGEEVEVGQDGGGEEGEGELDAGRGEGVAGVGGGDGEGGLLHGGDAAGVVAHEAEGVAIDAEEAGEGLGLAGPVDGVGVGEVVGVGPDGEVGVMGDQRCCGRAGSLLGDGGGEQRGEEQEREFHRVTGP